MTSCNVSLTWSSYTVREEHVRNDVEQLLDSKVNVRGDPILFIIACSMPCLKELLIQVCMQHKDLLLQHPWHWTTHTPGQFKNTFPIPIQVIYRRKTTKQISLWHIFPNLFFCPFSLKVFSLCNLSVLDLFNFNKCSTLPTSITLGNSQCWSVLELIPYPNLVTGLVLQYETPRAFCVKYIKDSLLAVCLGIPFL